MLQAYVDHVAEGAALGIPPLPLSAQQTSDLVELLKNAVHQGRRVPAGILLRAPGAGWRRRCGEGQGELPRGRGARHREEPAASSRARATELLGTMLGGYNISPLIDLLDDAEVGAVAAEGLKKTLLMFDQFHDVKEKADKGNANAKAVLQSWADAEWFTSRPEVPQSITVSIFKVAGEMNTDDLRPRRTPGAAPTSRCTRWRCTRTRARASRPKKTRAARRSSSRTWPRGHPLAYAGDVVGTGVAQERDQYGALVDR